MLRAGPARFADACATDVRPDSDKSVFSRRCNFQYKNLDMPSPAGIGKYFWNFEVLLAS
jgi:hypothetical protein